MQGKIEIQNNLVHSLPDQMALEKDSKTISWDISRTPSITN